MDSKIKMTQTQCNKQQLKQQEILKKHKKQNH